MARPTVVELFARQAARTPEATALAMREERWSYARLNEAAGQVAARLRALGAPPGARIAIAMDRSPRMVAVLLGVVRAGCAVVPLDVGYPAGRLAAMLEQARPFQVVCDAPYAHLAGDPSPARHRVPDGGPGRAGRGRRGSRPRQRRLRPVHLRLHRRPKGVTMPHRSLASLVAWQNAAASGAVGGEPCSTRR
ncbi:AMP-binding protein [Streptomyces stramineus]